MWWQCGHCIVTWILKSITEAYVCSFFMLFCHMIWWGYLDLQYHNSEQPRTPPGCLGTGLESGISAGSCPTSTPHLPFHNPLTMAQRYPTGTKPGAVRILLMAYPTFLVHHALQHICNTSETALGAYLTQVLVWVVLKVFFRFKYVYSVQNIFRISRL